MRRLQCENAQKADTLVKYGNGTEQPGRESLMINKFAALTVFIAGALGAFAVRADERIAYGEYLSGACVTCHQLSGIDNGIPSIVGWEEKAFVSTLMSYKSKQRDNQVMVMIATPLLKEEMEALAAYFATIKPKKQSDETS